MEMKATIIKVMFYGSENESTEGVSFDRGNNDALYTWDRMEMRKVVHCLRLLYQITQCKRRMSSMGEDITVCIAHLCVGLSHHSHSNVTNLLSELLTDCIM